MFQTTVWLPGFQLKSKKIYSLKDMKELSLNYHLMIDEKFIDDFVKDSQSISDNNRFIFTFDPPSKFVKTSHEGIHATYGSNQMDNILKAITKNDKIFVHWYSPKVNSILSKIPNETHVYLCFWGADFLESPFFSNPGNNLNKFLFDPLTLKYVKSKVLEGQKKSRQHNNKSARESKNIKNILATRVSNVKQSVKSMTSKAYEDGMRERAKFLNRIEAICHWNKFDIEILNDLYKVELRQQYFVYGVGTDEIKPPVLKGKSSDSNLTIWLGNSDTETNNHLDALEQLKRYRKENIKIICPLNYGNKKYATFVAEKGRSMFGDKFVALLDYIERDTYYSLMDEADIAFMPHNRGQAGGNLFAFIKKGKKIVMKEQSSIYKLFCSLGIQVDSSSIFDSATLSELKEPLSEEVIESNNALLNASISNEEKRLNALKTLLLK